MTTNIEQQEQLQRQLREQRDRSAYLFPAIGYEHPAREAMRKVVRVDFVGDWHEQQIIRGQE